MNRITTQITRYWLDEILSGRKKIEYREIKPYWTERLNTVSIPFELRLINGMNPPMPEAVLRIDKVDIGYQGTDGGGYDGKVYRFHIGKILSKKNI